MTTRPDDLLSTLGGDAAADRLAFAEGVFLSADDLLAEQQYHRARLARALDYLVGHGTAAGLSVASTAATARDTDGFSNDELRVTPGLAVDRVGRMVELTSLRCTRLDRWLSRPPPVEPVSDAVGRANLIHRERMVASARDDLDAREVSAGVPLGRHVVVDLYLRFVACERGLTPSFATGPFDALDAVTASRVRDAGELTLHLRDAVADTSTQLPEVPFAGLPALDGTAAPLRAWQDAVLGAWRHGTDAWRDRAEPAREPWMPADGDPSAVFLARLLVPVTVDDPTLRREQGGLPLPPLLDQHTRRPFAWTTAALFSMLNR
jgi:hypothetical protein